MDRAEDGWWPGDNSVQQDKVLLLARDMSQTEH